MLTRSLQAFIVSLVGLSLSASAVDSFVETFNGTGPYKSPAGQRMGLDNPGWSFGGDGVMGDGGYFFTNDPMRDGSEFDSVYRTLSSDCSYVQRIEIRELILDSGPGGPGIDSRSAISLDNLYTQSELRIGVASIGAGVSVIALIGQVSLPINLPPSPQIALEIHYDAERSEATFGYDNDIDDDAITLTFGPYAIRGSALETKFLAVAGGFGSGSGIVDYWSLDYPCEDAIGDFNGNGTLDVADIDLLSAAVRMGTNDPSFDLNADQLVDELDRTIWVRDRRRTYFGDSNLDGEFNSRDLVDVFQAAQYEDSLDGNSSWASGDWNGDADFTSRDLVLAFSDGGYEIGPRPAVQDVPEPGVLVTAILLGLAWIYRRHGI